MDVAFDEQKMWDWEGNSESRDELGGGFVVFDSNGEREIEGHHDTEPITPARSSSTNTGTTGTQETEEGERSVSSE